jgi:hypothetical protein
MKLYHYTMPGTSHLGGILAEGMIRTTESNMVPDGSGPRVVWLTDSDWSEKKWAAGLPKADARIEVEVDDAERWSDWATEYGMNVLWMAALADSGGDPESWFVREAPIQRWHLRAVEFSDDPAGVIAPLLAHLRGTRIEGDEFKRLLRSAAARRALNLPVSQRPGRAKVAPR